MPVFDGAPSVPNGRWDGAETPCLTTTDGIVINLVDRITHRMRGSGRTGRTFDVRMRFDHYSRATRSHTMRRTTAWTEKASRLQADW